MFFDAFHHVLSYLDMPHDKSGERSVWAGYTGSSAINFQITVWNMTKA